MALPPRSLVLALLAALLAASAGVSQALIYGGFIRPAFCARSPPAFARALRVLDAMPPALRPRRRWHRAI